jgi:hypothetical protein
LFLIFSADQTGSGKTRTAALIIKEMCGCKHKKKVLWVSHSYSLEQCVKDELDVLPFKLPFVVHKDKEKRDKKLFQENEKGLLFTCYTTLRSEKHEKLFEVADWMGVGFDGIIVFDEIHTARNMMSSTHAVVQWLQKKFPAASVLYMTATVGTKASDWACMTRLGLWGKNCPFLNVKQFVAKVEKEGLTVMEFIPIYLRSQGGFISRQLSLKDVDCLRIDVALTEEQKITYDKCTSMVRKTVPFYNITFSHMLFLTLILKC